MKNLIFKKLSLLSDKQRAARQVLFQKRFNLIIGKTNSVGKSTLVKNLFWSFGCDVRLDPTWENQDCKSMLEFQIDDQNYWIGRHGDRFFFSTDGNNFKVYSKIGGEFSELIANLVNFSVLLPIRNQDVVIVPPPAFYFLPFYIEQKTGWGKAWDGFDSLMQFTQWNKEVIPFHVGFIGKDYFNKTKEIYENKRKMAEVDDEIKRVSTAIEVVQEFVPEVVSTLNIEELDKIKSELREDVFNLHKTQEELFEELANLRSKKAQIESQLTIANEAVKELEKDYVFAQNEEDEIHCPTCGVVHDNSLVSKFSLLSDKDQAEQILVRLTSKLENINKSIDKKTIKLAEVREEIQKLNEKYYREEQNTVFTLQNVLESVAAHSVKIKVEDLRETKAAEYYDLTQKDKTLNAERVKSIKAKKEDVTKRFLEIYPAYIDKLRAVGVVASNIKSPEQYRKVANSGGAAEGVRGMLAYYVAIYNLISSYSEEVLSPLVIDTPNQHEQAPNHYESIVSFINDSTPLSSQIFLCAMDSPKLDPLKNKPASAIILLEKERGLLIEDEYEKTRKEIAWVYDLVNETDID